MSRATIYTCSNLHQNNKCGYALVMLSVIIAFLGTVLVTIMPDDTKRNFDNNSSTQEKLKKAAATLEIYYKSTGMLPCPARLDFMPSHPNFGTEDCAGNAPGEVIRHGKTRIGAIPTRKLSLPDEDAFDEWNNRIIYVMDARYVPIELNIRNLTDTAYLTDSSGKRPVALLLSHGPDNVGAYNRNGTINKPCTLIGANANNSELENCDLAADDKFISSLWDSSTANFYDDLTLPIYKQDFSYKCAIMGIDGCTLWIDASDSTSLTLSGNDVSQWRDKSGNDNHLNQALFLLRPDYVTSGLNGLNSVRFDGLVGDYLNSSMATPAFPYTIVAVYKASSSAGMIAGFNKTLGIAVREGLIKNGASTVALTQGDGGLFPNLTINAAASAADTHIAIGEFSGTNANYTAKLITNGTSSSAVGGSSRSSTSRSLNIGGLTLLSLYMTGDLAEILIFPRILSNSEKDLLNCYLADKWGVTVSTACLR